MNNVKCFIIRLFGGVSSEQMEVIKKTNEERGYENGYKTAFIEMAYFLQKKGRLGIKERYRRCEQMILSKASN